MKVLAQARIEDIKQPKMKLMLIRSEVMEATPKIFKVMIMGKVALQRATKILRMLELLEVTIMVAKATIAMKEIQAATPALVSSPTMDQTAGRRIEEHSLQLRQRNLAPACSRRLLLPLFNWLLWF